MGDGSDWVIQMASLAPPTSLRTQGRAVYDRNNMQPDRTINHMTLP